MYRRALVLAVITASLVLGGAAAAEAKKEPAKVGLVSFTHAGLSGDKASLTIDWPHVSGASRYEIFVSRSYSKVKKAKAYTSSTKSAATLKGLRPGTDYFVQVRALDGKKAGDRSSRVGHATIARHGTATGPLYEVLQYNLCASVKGCNEPWSWKTRRPKVLQVIAAHDPDIITMQESNELTRDDAAAVPGYLRIAYYSSKALLVRRDRFSAVPIPGAPASTLPPGRVHGCVASTSVRFGCIVLNADDRRYAVWGQVHDKKADMDLVVVSAHLSPERSPSGAAKRKVETQRLVAAIAEVNPQKLPVLVGGDFNSHKGIVYGDAPAPVMNGAGFTDAYDLAETLVRQHNSSYNFYRPTPVQSITWGDHIDHLWVQAAHTRVKLWANAGPMSGGRYTTPMPSDHNPLLLRVQVNRPAADRPSQRLAGDDRYSTAVALSRKGFPTGASTIYVATGEGYADGLAGGSRAARDDGPLLLVPGRGSLPAAVRAELARLGAGRIVLLGGTASVSKQVAAQLGAFAPIVDRVAGADRYATAAEVAQAWTSAPTVYLASGTAFPDALSGSALAARNDAPMLLSRPGSLPEQTVAALDRLQPTRVVVMGGAKAVSTAVERRLAARPGVAVVRIAGADRYATSAAALKASGALSSGTVVFASGQDFPDALAGTPLASRLDAGFALTRRECVPRPLDELLETLAEPRVYVTLGGKAVLGSTAITVRCD